MAERGSSVDGYDRRPFFNAATATAATATAAATAAVIVIVIVVFG